MIYAGYEFQSYIKQKFPDEKKILMASRFLAQAA
jgi:hypothetical protein